MALGVIVHTDSCLGGQILIPASGQYPLLSELIPNHTPTPSLQITGQLFVPTQSPPVRHLHIFSQQLPVSFLKLSEWQLASVPTEVYDLWDGRACMHFNLPLYSRS